MSLTTFTDLKGRAWNLSIDPDAARRIHAATSLDLLALRQGRTLTADEFKTIGEFIADARKCWHAVCEVAGPQLVKSGVTPDYWAAAVGSDEAALWRAFHALGYAFAEFLPLGRFAEVWTATIRAMGPIKPRQSRKRR